MDNITKDFKKIKETYDLYGVDAKIFINMKYVDVIRLKIKLCNNLINQLLDQHYLYRDNKKLHESLNAKKFNELLLKEMGLRD